MERFDRAHVERLRSIVAARLGLQVDDDKLDMLAEVFRTRLHSSGKASADSYLGALDLGNDAGEELRALASQLTISETYFFRAPEHFRVFTAVAVPDRMRVVQWSRPLRILSAGCASGDEAYSAAILLCEHFPQISQNVVVTGIDINPTMLAKARQAQYSAWALRETPPGTRQKCFHPNSNGYRLDDRIRDMVTFAEGNVAVENGTRWDQEQQDIIFCRNVIMYLTREAAHRAVARLTRALAPGGFLFLSHAETLRGMSQDFHLRHTHEAFYYEKRDSGDPPTAAVPVLPAFKPISEVDASWVDAVRCASEHIESLSRGALHHQSVASGTATLTRASERSTRAQLGLALDLLRREKYEAALTALSELPPKAASDSDAQLLRAVLLTNCGNIAAAEELCRQLLVTDELNASAHYLLALCREHAQDVARATEHDEAAIYLDPLFSMPHLHLGLLAKRRGCLEIARRQLEQADALLRREDASRILLLGGGFSREALIEFSQAQLRSCGGTS